jgi:hypothetical protein
MLRSSHTIFLTLCDEPTHFPPPRSDDLLNLVRWAILTGCGWLLSMKLKLIFYKSIDGKAVSWTSELCHSIIVSISFLRSLHCLTCHMLRIFTQLYWTVRNTRRWLDEPFGTYAVQERKLFRKVNGLDTWGRTMAGTKRGGHAVPDCLCTAITRAGELELNYLVWRRHQAQGNVGLGDQYLSWKTKPFQFHF